MIPIAIGAATSLLSGVSSAISSGLSKLTGQGAASESSQPSFAAQLKTATSQSSLGKIVHHQHAHGAVSTSANSSSSPSQTTSGSSASVVGSIINTSAWKAAAKELGSDEPLVSFVQADRTIGPSDRPVPLGIHPIRTCSSAARCNPWPPTLRIVRDSKTVAITSEVTWASATHPLILEIEL
jgi:hypothetical protein